MSGSGHDMSSMTMSGGVFTPTDEAIARGFWYGVAGCVGLLTAVRVASALQVKQRWLKLRSSPSSIPSRPQGWVSQAYATATATSREMLYPQPVYFTGRLSKYFSPLPVGRWLLLGCYWTVILAFLWSGTILKSSDSLYAYKWETVGFRAAWVSITQIPLIYLLSCKFNPISLLTGISYERFNWLHRWVARTVVFTAIVHWSFFFREWAIYNIVDTSIGMMPMIKYGFGAWGVITWMILTGFGFFRNVNYELFVVQHIVAAAVLLWVLFVHVPSYAKYNIWMSVAFVCFDWGARLVWAVLRNTHVLGRTKTRMPGYTTRLEPLPGDVVKLTIDDADFSWKAGQHAYITMPGLYRPFETHPFTIANASCDDGGHGRQKLTMLIQARSGFSRSLYKAALKVHNMDRGYRAFISGPWGTPPDLSHYDSVVLIACSTGASFVVPLLHDIVKRRGCVRRVTFHWIVRTDEHFAWFGEELSSAMDASRASDLHLQVFIHATRSHKSPSTDSADPDKGPSNVVSVADDSSAEQGSSLDRFDSSLREKASNHQVDKRSAPTLGKRCSGRPTLDSMIRPSVEQALGESAIVVCGGLAITAESRTYVAAISDERAVHKGTGAQGIFLFTETYGW
ncbi:hypothetical protein DOTSEDRAFT_85832 [Dothistroma septosporum NZE10]|uniref:ferric-chelate reductase (NADPH) n=1 Tax=Dothistroma septosporum (strain NZE10 / CBS 128990) TaxID=675120 RepID=N1PV05_DOTSN|nr:hypothetical protein DOTSEDRAFT_85832 [Dothistroma septosporum NZE10]